MTTTDPIQHHPAIANLQDMIRLRYGARDLIGFPKIQARQILSGGHKSRFRGRGMDFDQVRIYQPGDDVRSIDWRVTARTQVPHTKIFSEERERPILVITDLRSSMFFGSQQLKSIIACEVSAALAWAGLNANDRSGGIIFGQEQQMEIKPRRSHHAVLQFIHGLRDYSADLLSLQRNTEITSDNYSLTQIFEESRRFILPGSTIFIVSDFFDLDKECERHLFELSRHGSLNFCHIYDPIEKQLPPPSIYAVSDGKNQTLLDTGKDDIRARFERSFNSRKLMLKKMSERLSAGLISFKTTDNVMNVLRRTYGKKRSNLRNN
jgi:uncharacterized protein (DUF58 family)